MLNFHQLSLNQRSAGEQKIAAAGESSKELKAVQAITRELGIVV